MKILSEAQENYLKGMSEDKMWQSILDKVSTFYPEERYKPTDENEEKKIHLWIYRSGGNDAVEQLVQLLRGK